MSDDRNDRKSDRNDRLEARLTLHATVTSLRDEVAALRRELADAASEVRILRAETTARAALSPPAASSPSPRPSFPAPVGPRLIGDGGPYRSDERSLAAGGDALVRAEPTAIVRAPRPPRLSLLAAIAMLCGAVGHNLPALIELVRELARHIP